MANMPFPPPQMLGAQAPFMPPKENSQAKLFVSDIPRGMTSVDIFENFSKMGRCQVNVINNQMRLYQSAIIAYDAPSQAQAAMDKFRTEKVKEKYLRILGFESDRTRLFSNEGNIFVKDLPKIADFPMASFYKTFRDVGEIYSFKVGFNSEGKSIGYAFVRYKNPADAQKLEEQGQINFEGNQLTIVKYAPPQKSAESKASNNLYVKNFKPETTEEDLRQFFAKFGELVSVAHREGKLGKIGFVCYKNQGDALSASKELNGKYHPEICTPCEKDDEPKHLLYVQPHQKKELREILKLRQLEIFKRQWQRHNLYIKFIPADWTEDRLSEEFKQFGELKSYKIVKKQNQNDGNLSSTGVGYVCFQDPKGAEAALEHFKDRQGQNSLYVAAFESKSSRQKRLQKRFETQQNSLDQFLRFLTVMMNPRMMPPGGQGGMNNQNQPFTRMAQGLMQNMMPRSGQGQFNMQGGNNAFRRGNQMRGGNMNNQGRGGNMGRVQRGNMPHHLPHGPPPSVPIQQPPQQQPPMQMNQQHGMVPPNAMMQGQQPMQMQRKEGPPQMPMMPNNMELQNQQEQMLMQQKMAEASSAQMAQAHAAQQHQAYQQQQQQQGPRPPMALNFNIDFQEHIHNISRIKEIIGESTVLSPTQKQEVGEQLYNIFINYDKEYTPKVTGMLLEIQASVLKNVVDNPTELKGLFQQAVAMLQMQLQQQPQQ